MEHILLRLAFAPGLDTAVDAYFAYSDCTRASREPTLENRAWCGADLGFLALPLIGAAWARAGARIADAVPWGRADDAVDATRGLDRAGDASTGWKLGDPVNVLTREGRYPSWATARSRWWKNAAEFDAPGTWTPGDLARMRQGKAPIRDGRSLEIHHIHGRNIPDPHNPLNLRAMTWLEHRMIHGYVP